VALLHYNPVMESQFYGDGQHNDGVFYFGNLNPYIYTYQNPIKYIDPNGKQVNAVDPYAGVGQKIANGASKLWNSIKQGWAQQYSAKTNADKYGGLERYRQWQSNPGYNEGEGKYDRMFRLMGNSHREEMLDFGGGGYNMYGGYGRIANIEKGILNEAQLILKQEGTLNKIFKAGVGQEINIGGRTIIVEPEAPMSGLTLFEENAFVIGKDAFKSPLELRKTILHELYRLNTSKLKGQNVTQQSVSNETKAAFDFAEKNAKKLK